MTAVVGGAQWPASDPRAVTTAQQASVSGSRVLVPSLQIVFDDVLIIFICIECSDSREK